MFLSDRAINKERQKRGLRRWRRSEYRGVGPTAVHKRDATVERVTPTKKKTIQSKKENKHKKKAKKNSHNKCDFEEEDEFIADS
ncbi:hypothetical protein NDU88_007160 [Pleurodeles waltl]|uniref:Uncharacterized protein n=1 Tax=Pleurodeles waltl TaxID=8319 RepID=A0AAV7SRT1_PLEWA|nr:hypothetical protein NDU88_007160 [Pleurodeles waltl]